MTTESNTKESKGHTKEHSKSHAKHAEHKSHKNEHHKAESKSHAKAANNSNSSNQNSTVKTVIITAIIVLFLVFVIQNLGGIGEGIKKQPTQAAGGEGVVTIVEFSDFECPFCGRAQATLEQVKNTYGDSVVFEFKHFPLSFHPNAQKASEASECARDQGKFWEYHDVLFQNQDKLSITNLKSYASDLGLDVSDFNSCLDSGEKAGIVAADMAEGRALGVTGTPGFNIGGEMLVGAQPFSAFKEIIDRKLAEGGADIAPAAAPADDPVVEMIVIDDPTCGACDAERIVQLTQTELFPSAQITRYNKDDAAAQALIAELGLTALPAFIFDSAVTKTANYAQVSQALVQSGDTYYIAPGAAGSVKLLADIDVSGRPMKGDANAPVTIVEFSDFECPFCAKFYSETYGDLLAQYVDSGDAKIVFMHFPLNFHANAEKAAVATECAFEQGKFWEYHDLIFENQAALGDAALKAHAVTLGLDTAQFDACLDSNKYLGQVQADLAYGSTLGVSGTPGFFVNGIQLSGALPIEAFQQVIDAELN